MRDDTAMRRWIAMDLGTMHRGLVTNPVRLSELLAMDEPQATDRSGEVHPFDPDALARFAEALGPLTRAEVRLPITLTVDTATPADCSVADQAAIRALHDLGETTSGERDGRLWMGLALGHDLARRYPGCFQFVHL